MVSLHQSSHIFMIVSSTLVEDSQSLLWPQERCSSLDLLTGSWLPTLVSLDSYEDSVVD